MENAVFSRQNRLFQAKLCPGTGTEFKDLVTSLVVFVYEVLLIDSLLFSLDLVKCILHIVNTY